MDRWCSRCNAYRTTWRCGPCGGRTEAMQVVPLVPDPPKVTCACGAPFAGFRFQDQSGFGVGFRHSSRLSHDRGHGELSIEIAMVPGQAGGAWGGDDSQSFVPLDCPHCQAPMLKARVLNLTRSPVVATPELGTKPDGAIVLVVCATARGYDA